MATLDSIDRRLLAELQDEGRVTNVDLARRVGLTAPPCLRRVRALEEAGVIRGYHADLDPASLGFTITVFAMVSLKSQAEEDLRAFENHIKGLPEVRECHMLNGEIDVGDAPFGLQFGQQAAVDAVERCHPGPHPLKL